MSDVEWEEAEKADETPIYYWVYLQVNRKTKYIKLYKPSVAKLVAERTGWILVKVYGGGA